MSDLVLQQQQPPPMKADHNSLFHWLRWRLLENSWRSLAGGSIVRPLTILFSSLVVWIFVFLISFGGFRLLRYEGLLPLSGQLVGILFDLLFVSLGFFLMFSGGLIIYGSLFKSPETAFLLASPIRSDRIFAYKYQTAVSFSSWAFLLLGSPILIAYGGVCDSPWFFYLFLPIFFLGFVLIPSSIGGLLCLLIVNFFPRKWKQILWALGFLVAIGLIYWFATLPPKGSRPPPEIKREEVNRLLDRFSFASKMWVPSHWVVSGLRSAAVGNLGATLYYLAIVWSNGLLLYLVAVGSSRFLYRKGYNRIATGGSPRKKYGGQWIDRCLEYFLFFLKPGTRTLLVKDFRTFRREPQQWAQILIFTVLMLLYILNIRKMFINGIEWRYQNSISLLNLSAVCLLVCTYTGRFVFPLLSLEGKKFWVLGLLPIRRETILWGKFAFSTTGTLVIATLLILLSDIFLDMPLDILLLHLLTVVVVSTGLSGLSVGMGAMMPNFRENDPSKIAVGFGGTLNLVIGLVYLLVILGVMAFPWHFQMFGGQTTAITPVGTAIIILGAMAGVVLGTCAVVVSLQMGVQALRRMEF